MSKHKQPRPQETPEELQKRLKKFAADTREDSIRRAATVDWAEVETALVKSGGVFCGPLAKSKRK
jgi:hypothetical protein